MQYEKEEYHQEKDYPCQRCSAATEQLPLMQRNPPQPSGGTPSPASAPVVTQPSYFDSSSNFFVTTAAGIDSLHYKSRFTTIDERRANETGISSVIAPSLNDPVESAAKLLMELPLDVAVARHIPTRAARRADDEHQSTPGQSQKNFAKLKWGSVTFADDKAAVKFHAELTNDITKLRLAMRKVNTKIEYPATVPDEALQYFRPDARFAGWEMFDGQKHIDSAALERISLQRLNAARDVERRNQRRLQSAGTQGQGSSPSLRSKSPSSPRSPSRAASSSPQQQLPPSKQPYTVDKPMDPMASVDVHRLVTDEEVDALFHPDEVAREIAGLKWDFAVFRPPEAWRRQHQKRMEALTRKAEAWRPMELKQSEPDVRYQSARVTSMPAISPFRTSGLSVVDPKVVVPATSQGSGIQRSQLQDGHLQSAFVVRADPSTSIGKRRTVTGAPILHAPVIVEGMTWGELQQQIEGS